MGRARYSDDITPPGTLHAAFLRSPHAHARLLGIDASRALALDGVHAVATGHDLRAEPPFTTTIPTRSDCKIGTRRLLTTDKVRHVGEPVAVVVARNRYVAEDALELIAVEYELPPAVMDPEAALAPGAPLIHEELGDNDFATIRFSAGDPDAVFARAAHRFAKRFHFGRTHAAPLEGRGVIADWDAIGGRVTVWTSTQMPHLVRGLLAAQFGVPENRLRVICPAVAYRGVGWTSEQTAREALIDDIARELGIDPVEIRLRNAIPDGEPYLSATGASYGGGSFSESIRRAMQLVDYDELRARQEVLRRDGRYVGIGISPFVEQIGWAARIAAVNGFPGFAYLDSVSAAMEPDGTVTVASGFQANGQGHETTLAQVVADELSIPFESIRVVQGDTDAVPYATGSYGSHTAVVGGGAAMRAAGDVRAKLLCLGAHLLEASPDDVELADGQIRVQGSPAQAVTVQQAAGAAYFGPRPDDLDPTLSAIRSYDPPETYSNACIAVVVEVDVQTGKVTIDRLVAVEDCGTIVNPLVVDGQVSGALADFLYPTATELPAIEVDHIETPSPVTEGGFKGMGEGGLIGGPAAIVNAVADALAPFGVRIERTPLRPCDVLELIQRAQGR